MNFSKNQFKKGGVSMFIVIITTVLIALITASFLRLMTRDQQNASVQDLSQSSYDSAQAGVEDAKRFMAELQQSCYGNSRNDSRCTQLKGVVGNTNQCQNLGSVGIGENSGGETRIQTSSGAGGDLNQAYTCLKIIKDTPDFLGEVNEGEVKTIPLRGSQGFNRVRISWHTRKNLPESGNVTLDNFTSSLLLRKMNEWGDRPALIRAQFYGKSTGTKSFDQLNTNFSDDGVGIDEQLYYPVSSAASTAISRHTLPNSKREVEQSVSPVFCRNDLTLAYFCQVDVDFGALTIPIEHEAFLRLSPIYKGADFKVELFNGDTLVNFNGVQPIVDSTGRANDQFRRIESRLELNGADLPLPDFAIQNEGSTPICKDFWVTFKSNNINKCES